MKYFLLFAAVLSCGCNAGLNKDTPPKAIVSQQAVSRGDTMGFTEIPFVS